MRKVSISLLSIVAAWADTGSAACASCHQAIYDTWKQSAMARTSGPTGDGRERFTASGFRAGGASYRVSPEWKVNYEHGAVRGEFPMQWFIGSGKVGRSYAGLVDGFLFQSPASYFSARETWGLSPGFAAYPFVQVARPVEQPCLTCHASGARVLAGHENRYAEPLFQEGGVSCERCHGPGEAHVAGQAKILNPVKLGATQRDSVCLQCHLTGALRIAQPGRGPDTFRPGDKLSDHLMVFIQDRAGPERAATDHAEQLSRSRCQQRAGAKLWCGTCHDAHSGLARANACRDCHPKQHAKGGPQCADCHMPKAPSREGEHVVYTDHTIARKPRAAGAGPRSLRPFPGMEPSPRDWAIAERRRDLLETLAAQPDADVAVLVQLAQLYDNEGKGAALYERALKLEPDHATAAANLGIYRMKQGRAQEALAMWERTFARNPGMLNVGLNLALARMQAGDRPGARATLERVLRFHPNAERARALLGELAKD